MSMASAEEKQEHGAASSYLYEPQSQTIARDVMASTSLAHEVASFGIRLYSYSDAPHYLQGNPHITAGYRAHLSTEMCVKRCVCVCVGVCVCRCVCVCVCVCV